MLKKYLNKLLNKIGGKNNMHPHYKSSNKFWVQKMPYKRISNRFKFFVSECTDKDVIHFGCTDWPIFNPKNNLHIKLSEYTKSLDGFDIDLEGVHNLKSYVNQDYYSEYSEIPNKKYDVCLIPETIEHVDNVEIFLKNVANVNAKKYFITAPNCFSEKRQKNYIIKNKEFIEIVHPDHNYWFSPYTLKNSIEKYSNLKVIKSYLMESDDMICCEAIKQ